MDSRGTVFLFEIKLGCSFESILAVTHEELVAIQGQDLPLRIVPLDLNSQHRFLNFPPETPLRREKEILAQLLSQRASAFNETACHEVFQPGSRDAVDINAPMSFEILVFHRDDGVFHQLRDLLPGDDNEALQRETADDLATDCLHAGDQTR